MDKNTLFLSEANNKIIEKNLYYELEHCTDSNDLFNKECLKEFTTLKGRIDALKVVYNYRYNVPIYINNGLLFIKIKNEEILWVNVHQVIEITKDADQVLIVFPNEIKYRIKANYRTIIGSYKKTMSIIKNKNVF
jgi:hypothetical protein